MKWNPVLYRQRRRDQRWDVSTNRNGSGELLIINARVIASGHHLSFLFFFFSPLLSTCPSSSASFLFSAQVDLSLALSLSRSIPRRFICLLVFIFLKLLKLVFKNIQGTVFIFFFFYEIVFNINCYDKNSYLETNLYNNENLFIYLFILYLWINLFW